MLDEVKQLQDNAVSKLVSLVKTKNEITFKAPTGSGKTHIMAHFMDRVLSENKNVIFIVSSLSKAELAKQNYEAFVKYIDDGNFPNLNPYLISSDNSSEASLFIPTGYNVYVLPRDLYKDKSKLKDDATLLNFLQEIKDIGFGKGYEIYVIKDECHVATTNLDELKKSYFNKIINFSATPKLSRGQYPDVEIKESDAVATHLIKTVEMGDETDTLEDALNKFVEIKSEYLKKNIGVNPCMIIQISNKDKAEEEIIKIKNLLSEEGFSSLKWMLILDKNGGTAKGSDTNDILGAKKQPLSKWKYFAKLDTSTIDIIIFKMVITEGWDIRRACMLYQVRDSKSKQLDEQVIGRVRRNPRLLDFEKLDKEAQELVSKAYVWGVKKQDENSTQLAILFGDEQNNQIQNEIKIQTTRLKAFKAENIINIDELNLKAIEDLAPRSIFDLYRDLKNSSLEVQELYKNYVDSVGKFFVFTNNIDSIKKEIDKTCCDYSQFMVKTMDEQGKVCEATVPFRTSFSPTEHRRNIENWIWRNGSDNEQDEFSFDSLAEKDWAKKLSVLKKKDLIKKVNIEEEDVLLFGKNYLENSQIKYEYYSSGRHFSYPDFVMKDNHDRIHIFEVKSLNFSTSQNIDSEEYREKVRTLKEFYTSVSKFTPHYYHLPIKNYNLWTIWVIKDGICENKSYDDFVNLLKEG